MKKFRYKRIFKHYEVIGKRISSDGYVELRIINSNGGYQWIKRYKLVYELYKGPLIIGMHVHHIDFDKFNDKPKNLTQITREEHAAIHGKEYNVVGGSSRMLGKKHSKKTKQKMRESALGSKKSFYSYITKVKKENKHKIRKKGVDVDEDLITIQAANQRLTDKNRISNKLLKENVRLTNATSELYEELLNKIPKVKNFEYEKSEGLIEITDKSAIVQVSDLHLNEVVLPEDCMGINVHNYDVASRRLWKYAKKIKETLGKSVSHILVALTGDLLNSDRRPDEVLTNAGNRSEALIFALQILKCFLLDLAEDYHLTIATVYGNESRLTQDIPWSNPTHNYDFLIHKLLSQMLEDYQDRIVFLELERNYERVVEVIGANILLTHGHTKIDWKKAVTKYAAANIILHYMIIGHLHSTKIDDKYARSASTVGANFYSTYGLNLAGRASQNIYIIEKEKGAKVPSINPMAIDLQNTEGCGSYTYDKDVCKSGMRKSVVKKGTNKIIIKVVE